MELKKTKPKLECIHCDRQMSWDPSTKRKKHLLIQCTQFAPTETFKDAKVVAEREQLLFKMGRASLVCFSHLLE